MKNDIPHIQIILIKHIHKENPLFKKLTSAIFPNIYFEKSQLTINRYLTNSRFSFKFIKFFDKYITTLNIIGIDEFKSIMLNINVTQEIIIYIGILEIIRITIYCITFIVSTLQLLKLYSIIGTI